MNDHTENIIVDTAPRIFQDLCEPATVNEAEKGEWPKALWDALEESGLPLAWVPDDLGGAGATMADGFAVLRIAGRFAAPVPLAETLMAGWLLARAGITVPNGPMTVAPGHADGHIALSTGGKLRGRARGGPIPPQCRPHRRPHPGRGTRGGPGRDTGLGDQPVDESRRRAARRCV